MAALADGPHGVTRDGVAPRYARFDILPTKPEHDAKLAQRAFENLRTGRDEFEDKI